MPVTYEDFLETLCERLRQEIAADAPKSAAAFERLIRESINDLGGFNGELVSTEPKAQEFPDVPMGRYGIEVKFTEKDTWRSIANSVSEGSRNADVTDIYVVFGKMGGTPEIRWARYEDVVMHVRTSHVPRFEIEMGAEESLFRKIGVSYPEFCKLPMHEKMEHIRGYARGRLKEGEKLWWLEGDNKPSFSLPVELRLYMNLSQQEKRKLRAEGVLLCPQVVAGSRVRTKYSDVVMYILMRHGVLCPQARDLFSAGSVALRGNASRGGNYILRALLDIADEMREAAYYLEDELFIEYWGQPCAPEHRIKEWLRRADEFAKGQDWKPSEHLFLENYGSNG
ncbi:hypothetical protein GGR34_003304 [Microvirga flocculans]|uniref:Restriction endonuclease n=1 Tax=Microvirga flocculans TaxID=217168 RepID=A0A7W6N9E2_9HYPH|nr:hypothetical protein [Microvirga flocculans]MBB4041626.1 hypothetical protein [Microvirga flocculans]